MKKLLFMMMIASNLNAMNVNYWQRLEIEEQAEKRAQSDVQMQIIPAKPTILEVSRERERDKHMWPFLVCVHSMHALATHMKNASVTEESDCIELRNKAKHLLSEMNNLNGIKNHEKNRESSNFLFDTKCCLEDLSQIMNTASGQLVKQQLYEINKTYIGEIEDTYHTVRHLMGISWW